MDLPGIARAIRTVAPGALIIVDGIQHACHGGIDVAAADVDGYVISPYKVFSRHGYGVAWVGDRLTGLGPEQLHGGPQRNWELGTRDTGAYATFSDVVDYFDWLGGQVGGAETRRGRIEDPAREGLVCFWADALPAPDIVERLNAEGIRTHTRKADHYSGNILDPLGQDAAVRVSMCHYN